MVNFVGNECWKFYNKTPRNWVKLKIHDHCTLKLMSFSSSWELKTYYFVKVTFLYFLLNFPYGLFFSLFIF